MNYNKLKLIEADEDKETLENTEDTQDEVQKDAENTEELEDVVDEEKTEEDETLVDEKLNELREILPDLDLSLYRLVQDEKNIYYIVGKLDDDGETILMLTEKNPKSQEDEIVDDIKIEDTDDIKTKDAEDVIQNEEEIPEAEETLEIKDDVDIKDEYEFVPLPYELENVLKLSPIYSNDDEAQLPDHDKLVDYLMQQLIEIDPERAEEIKTGKEVEDDIEVQDDTEDYEEIPQEDITIDDEEEDENYD